MKNILNPYVWFGYIMKLFGYSRSVLAVKKGTLEFDRSRTIGNAFDTYTYFEKTLWKELSSHTGKKVVQVEGLVDIDFLSLDEMCKNILKSIKIIAHFNVSQDMTFQLSYVGIETIKLNGIRVKYDILEHEIMLCIQDIYANKPLR